MAFDDIPLEDAGRDYYAKQFGDRVRKIRKYGNAPARHAGGGSGWKAVAGVVAVLIIIRVIVAVVVAVSQWSSGDFDANELQPPNSPPMILDGDRIHEPQPWQLQQRDDGDFPPQPPLLGPNDDPANLHPGLAPVVPDQGRQPPDKDD